MLCPRLRKSTLTNRQLNPPSLAVLRNVFFFFYFMTWRKLNTLSHIECMVAARRMIRLWLLSVSAGQWSISLRASHQRINHKPAPCLWCRSFNWITGLHKKNSFVIVVLRLSRHDGQSARLHNRLLLLSVWVKVNFLKVASVDATEKVRRMISSQISHQPPRNHRVPSPLCNFSRRLALCSDKN